MRPPVRLRRGIGLGLTVLVALMPFHAFLSVWLGSITHHQAIIQAWKEALLLVLAGLGLLLAFTDAETRDRLRSLPVLLAGLFALTALIVTVLTHPTLTAAAFGIKTDLEFLVAFVLAVMVATPTLIKRLIAVILIATTAVAIFSLLQVTVLPAGYLGQFGYGPTTIAPYQTLGPGSHTLRFASTLGGPNQLGTFLILPTALALVVALRRRRWWLLGFVPPAIIALVHTYSRAAWLGMLGAVVVIVLVFTQARIRAWVTAALASICIISAGAIAYFSKTSGSLKSYVFHGADLWHSGHGSDFEHLASLQRGASATLAQPLGHGLGTAGPAVFHSGSGLIIENDYLQLAYETGLFGALVFIAFIATTGWQLAWRSAKNDLAAATLAAIIGISITSLFLPSWTDSSTALTVWICAGAALGLSPETRHV